MRLIDADALIDKTDDRYSLHEIGRRERDDIVDALEYAPTIQPEIVHCKDCRKHNKKLGFDENYNITYKDDACPLIPWRGMSKGHEHDYQSCSFAERREVTT